MDIWGLLHLNDRRQAFPTSNEAKSILDGLWKEHFGRPYHKTEDRHYDLLKAYLDRALERAALIERQAQRDATPPHDRNPYFTLHHLIAYLRSL
jgi:hypothetical protein